MRRGLMGVATRLMGEYENFMRAYPPVDGNPRVAKDFVLKEFKPCLK